VIKIKRRRSKIVLCCGKRSCKYGKRKKAVTSTTKATKTVAPEETNSEAKVIAETTAAEITATEPADVPETTANIPAASAEPPS